MRDQYRTLMLASLKDAMAVVDEYNEWCEETYGNSVGVPPQAVPQIALMLYRSRAMQTISDATSFDVPDFDDKMYE